MIGTLGAKLGMSPQQITRSNDVKKSENNGTYKLDMSKTAKAVADTLL